MVAVHRFEGLSPWENLAREEVWLDALPPGESALVLYVNGPCVVLGKNQNPMREVRLAETRRRGVPVIRRASGGGTVWHDEGNLNWSFLLPKEGWDRRQVAGSVADALTGLGAMVTVSDKGDLLAGDRKVSGSAYLVRRDRVLHHGTLLCRARLDDLRGVLGATGTVSDWVGVASRPMPVTNLDLDVEAAAGALAALAGSADDGYGDAAFEARVAARCVELKSAAWRWDQTPPFTWEGATRAGWLKARVREGLIEAAWDDRRENMSKIVGMRFFDPELFEYIDREAP